MRLIDANCEMRFLDNRWLWPRSGAAICALMSTRPRLVALPRSGDLFIYAKELFDEANFHVLIYLGAVLILGGMVAQHLHELRAHGTPRADGQP